METIRLRMGEIDGRAFHEFLAADIATANGPKNLSVTFRESSPATGGFGMQIPPEVFIIVLKTVGLGVATGVSEKAGEYIWVKVREFFSKRPNDNGTLEEVELLVDDKRVLIDPRQPMPPDVLRGDKG